MFEVGDKIKLKDYDMWVDYQDGEVCTITRIDEGLGEFGLVVRWDNDRVSHVNPSNAIRLEFKTADEFNKHCHEI